LAATVVAPIFEEIVYRLLLIGALERWEDQITGWPWSLPPRDRFADFDPAEGELTLNAEAQAHLPSPNQLPPDDPPLHYPGLLGGLSHGWFPVLVSALLFSLAHLGQGPSPIPLFIFAIIVGYAYQRTHRLLPCVVAHFVFNGLSIALLWLSLSTVES